MDCFDWFDLVEYLSGVRVSQSLVYCVVYCLALYLVSQSLAYCVVYCEALYPCILVLLAITCILLVLLLLTVSNFSFDIF